MVDKIKSDGGSSDYYKIKLPKRILKDNEDGTVTIETGDIIRYALSNDFNLGNIFKVLIRWGKKEGIDYQYDRNKIVYFADDHVASKAPALTNIVEITAQPKVVVWYKNEGEMPDWVEPSTSIYTLLRCDEGDKAQAMDAAPSSLSSFRWEILGSQGDIMEWTYADHTT